MQKILATVHLFLIGSLTVSVFSPGIHESLFHGGKKCSQSHSQIPCSGHGDPSSDEDNIGSCAVLLFGNSTDVPFLIDLVFKPSPLLEEVCISGTWGVGKLEVYSNNWVRGPPSLV